jgi:hypothetical protein
VARYLLRPNQVWFPYENHRYVHGQTNRSAAQGLHINPLEFLAFIINLWLALKIIGGDPICMSGFIIDLLSDNITALSWMHVAATTPNPELQQLAHFASALFEQEQRSRYPKLMIKEWASSFVGTQYFTALSAEDVLNLPTPARAAGNSSISNFLTQDRGVRQGNGGTADSRFVFCARWLDKMKFTQQSAAILNDGQTTKLLGAYTFITYGTALPSNNRGPSLIKLSVATLELLPMSSQNSLGTVVQPMIRLPSINANLLFTPSFASS